MYIYVFVSTIFISCLIAKGCQECCRKKRDPEEFNFEESRLNFSNVSYLKNVNLLSYFSEENNFTKLQKILDRDNGIFEKTKNLIENDEDIKKDFELSKEFYTEFYPFEMEPKVITVFGINNKKIESSIGQLNFFHWLFENDYLLHIE